MVAPTGMACGMGALHINYGRAKGEYNDTDSYFKWVGWVLVMSVTDSKSLLDDVYGHQLTSQFYHWIRI
jgi:hypothetical protein